MRLMLLAGGGAARAGGAETALHPRARTCWWAVPAPGPGLLPPEGTEQSAQLFTVAWVWQLPPERAVRTGADRRVTHRENLKSTRGPSSASTYISLRVQPLDMIQRTLCVIFLCGLPHPNPV